MPKHTKKSSFLKDIILIFACFAATIIGYKHFHKFGYHQILNNSVLKQKSFNTDVQEITSKQGLKAYLLTDTTNPIISISFIFKNSGSASEAENELGLTTVLSSVLLDGAGEYSSQNFKELLEENAITISFKTTIDDFGGELTFIKNKQDLATELLSATLLNPHLNIADINQSKDELIAAQNAQQESPSKLLNLEFNKEIYGVHPYANNPLGDSKTIANITQKSLRKFIKTHFTQDNLIIGISGDITTDEAKNLIDNIFANLLKNTSITNYQLPITNYNFSPREKLIPQNIPQNITAFATPGVCRNAPEFYPLYIANHILGGSQMQSRLFLLTRENEGLTYGVATYLSLLDDSCTIKGTFASSAENMPKMIGIIKNEWQKMHDNGVSEAELQAAKDYLISSFNLRFSSIAEIAEQLAQMQKQNLGINFLKERNNIVQNVKIEDVNHAAKMYFNTNETVFVSIGK